MRILIFLALFLIGALGSPAWGVVTEGKIPVAASILPMGDFCKNIGGDRVAVQVLIPPGASPHVYEPTPGAVVQALKAGVFVYVGAGLDPWATRLLKTLTDPRPVVVEAVQGMELLQEVPSSPGQKPPGPHRSPQHAGVSGAQAHPHDSGGNPHVWLDPVLAQDICRRIAQAFIQVDPDHKEEYQRNLSRYLAQLEDLDQEITKQAASFRHRSCVSFHPAFAYFNRRYGLQNMGVIEAAPGREPSPGHLQQIIAAIKTCQGRAVFAEPQLSPRVAEVIAQEAGVKVLFLDPLGGRPPYGSDYLKVMRHNLAVLTEALK